MTSGSCHLQLEVLRLTMARGGHIYCLAQVGESPEDPPHMVPDKGIQSTCQLD